MRWRKGVNIVGQLAGYSKLPYDEIYPKAD